MARPVGWNGLSGCLAAGEPRLANGTDEMSEGAKPNEHRRAPRRRVLLAGKLAYGEGLSCNCAIREESETGARIIVGDELLPRQVVLVSVTRSIAYEAEIMWRRGKEAGLRFHQAHPLKSASVEASSQLRLARRLWTEALARGSD